jgi:hypothetical protein
MFGLLLSGRPVITDWSELEPGFSFATAVPLPGSVSDLSVFLLPGNEFPDGYGLAIHYSVPPFILWSSLGALHPAQPSITVRTGWSSTPEIANSSEVRIGLQLMPLKELEALSCSTTQSAEFNKRAYAQLVARDLENFVASFGGSIPTDVIGRWTRRFDEKLARDPDFLLKKAGVESGDPG